MTMKIGFIGAGKMATAIIEGLLNSNHINASLICASRQNEQKAKEQADKLGINVYTYNSVVAKESDIIFLAVKPHLILEVIEEIKEFLTPENIIVSIAAGVSTCFIEESFNSSISVIRVMPNTPSQIQKGMFGVVKGQFADEQHLNKVLDILSNIGESVVIEEENIDVLTAISGSGPAFFYKIFDDIAKAGDKLGLDYKQALELCLQTAIGSAEMMKKSDKTAEELIEQVASKGGCTEAGVNYLKEINSSEIFENLIKKTAQKSKEMSS